MQHEWPKRVRGLVHIAWSSRVLQVSQSPTYHCATFPCRCEDSGHVSKHGWGLCWINFLCLQPGELIPALPDECLYLPSNASPVCYAVVTPRVSAMQEADKSQRVQVTAFQSKQQGSQTLPPQRGSWDLDSPMAAAISASMEGDPCQAYSAICLIQSGSPKSCILHWTSVKISLGILAW